MDQLVQTHLQMVFPFPEAFSLLLPSVHNWLCTNTCYSSKSQLPTNAYLIFPPLFLLDVQTSLKGLESAVQPAFQLMHRSTQLECQKT